MSSPLSGQASEQASGPVRYSEILYEVDPDRGVLTLTLNRPERRNPIGPVTVGELLHALDRAAADPAVRVVVLTGAGKVFSAGGDLGQMAQTAQREPGAAPLTSSAGATGFGDEPRRAGSFADLNEVLVGRGIGKPTIAMVNGHALAGGLGLAVACDLALAAEDAQFGTPEINVGLFPMMIMSTIFRNVPRKRAMELILTGERISAAEAERIGLITRAVPRERLAQEVAALADKLRSKSPLVMGMGLTAFHRMQDLELGPALRYLEGELGKVLTTEDASEGLAAFLQKRAPLWRGR